jgi:hypothetical protein
MTTQEAIDLVTAFLQKNPGSGKQAIIDATEVKGITFTNALKKLRKDELLIEEGEGDDASYSINEVAETSTEQEPESTEDAEEDTATKKGRNNQKYKLPGDANEYGKGGLVREIVRQHVAETKPSLKQLKEAFPDELLKRFGVFQDEDTARSIQGARDRYFWKEEHQIKLKDKKVIVVCNQWTSENIQPFLKTARALGYKIKAA